MENPSDDGQELDIDDSSDDHDYVPVKSKKKRPRKIGNYRFWSFISFLLPATKSLKARDMGYFSDIAQQCLLWC